MKDERNRIDGIEASDMAATTSKGKACAAYREQR